MLQGAIFDLDGTLLDSMGMWDHLGSDYLRSIGCEPSPDLDEQLRPLSMEDAAAFLRRTYDIALSATEIAAGVKDMIRCFYEKEVVPRPGAEAFLRFLQEHGVRMCIATATDRELAEAALTRCGLSAYFCGVLSCGEVGAGKEQPDIFRRALVHLGTPKSRTAVFEDAVHALSTAKKDGFFTVAVHDASEPDQAAARQWADVYLPDYASAALWGRLLEMKGRNEPCADV